MAIKDILDKFEGYENIQRDNAVLENYGFDYQTKKGDIEKITAELHPKRLKLRVSEIRAETISTKTFKLAPINGSLPPFLAGQYINIFVDVGGIRTSRPYSIASSPSQTGYYEIAVRKVEDGFVSNYLLDNVKIGDNFESTSPCGNFYYNPLFHGDNLVFIAGGSGITPFMSMIRELADKDLKKNVHLFYGCRIKDDIIFGQELERITAAHSNFTFDIVVSEPPKGFKGRKGFITKNLIMERLGSIDDRTYYLCGPEMMYNFCRAELKNLGLPDKRIKVEVMGAPKNISAQPGWPEGINGSDVFKVSFKNGKTINAKAGEPLMVSLERAGLLVEASCRSGECSLCRTKLLSGKVFQPGNVKIRKSDRQFGYIHPCLAYPLENIELISSSMCE